jgi:hypothetical protein
MCIRCRAPFDCGNDYFGPTLDNTGLSSDESGNESHTAPHHMSSQSPPPSPVPPTEPLLSPGLPAERNDSAAQAFRASLQALQNAIADSLAASRNYEAAMMVQYATVNTALKAQRTATERDCTLAFEERRAAELARSTASRELASAQEERAALNED